MTISFALLLDAALKGTLILLAAGAATMLLRRGSAAGRHLIWALAVIAMLALPLLKLATPWKLPLLPELRSPLMTSTASPAPAVDAALDEKAAWTNPELDEKSPVATSSMPNSTAGAAGAVEPVGGALSADGTAPLAVRMLKLLGIFWLAVASVLLLRLAAGFVLVRWFALRAYPLYEDGWAQLNAELCALAGLKQTVQLYGSPHIATPMTWGTARPVIMLPSAAEDWTDERRRVVLLHELAHIRRRDSLSHTFAQVTCAVYWFHPLVWKAAARMRAEAERASDDLVLACGTKASVYADHLLELIRTIGNMRTPALALPMAQRSTFEGRLLAILEPHVDRTTPKPFAVLGMVAVVVLFVLPLAGLTTASAISTETLDEPANHKSEIRKEWKKESSAANKVAGVETVHDAIPSNPNAALIADAAMTHLLDDVQEKNGSQYALAPLTRALRDSDALVRIEAAKSLGQMEDTLAVAALSKALREDTDARVRKMAAWALGNIECEEGVPALVHAMRRDRDREVRRTAVWALGQIEHEDAVPALAETIGDSDPEIAALAVWALGQIEDESAVPALSQVLKSGSTEMRRQAAWALGQIEDERAVPALTAALRDTDAEVRDKAVWALGEIESPASVGPLLPLLQDANPDVRKQVAWALGQIEDAGAVTGLAAALKDASPDVRKQAAWALGQIESRPAPQALMDALKDGDSDVRRTAAWALAQIEDPRSAGALRAALKDGNAEVRRAVLRALVSIGDEAGYDHLADMLKDPDPEVRRAAAAAMGGRHSPDSDPRPQSKPRPQTRPQPIR